MKGKESATTNDVNTSYLVVNLACWAQDIDPC